MFTFDVLDLKQRGGLTVQKGDNMIEYIYGMRLRGFAPGCQPMEGFSERLDGTGRYHDMLVYDRKLTDKELRDYELDYVGLRAHL